MSESFLVSKHFYKIVFIYYFSLFEVFYFHIVLFCNSKGYFVRVYKNLCDEIENNINGKYSIESNTYSIEIMYQFMRNKPYQS